MLSHETVERIWSAFGLGGLLSPIEAERRVRRNPAIVSAVDILLGIGEGFPICCVAQFANDRWIVEEWYPPGLIRGNVRRYKNRDAYVPCWDCYSRRERSR